jgi:hypothetical protein
MKKVLLAGAALMLVSGIASTASAAAVEPGVKITGDARVRLWYMSEEYSSAFGNLDGYDSRTDMDSRVRLNIAGTAAGGAYAKVRLRVMETMMGDSDKDSVAFSSDNNNLWADQAFVGVPFTDQFTLEVGKYRSTYGPMGTTYNFFYDDVNLSGARGIVKLNDIEINPFIEWMEEAQIDDIGTDKNNDNDEMRFGAHIKAKLNKEWTVGGMLGYQSDERNEITNVFDPNEGFFGSIYTNGKSGAFGLIGELAVTEAELNGMNSWQDDNILTDRIGSADTGFGGYVFPNFTMDKLNLGLNLGFTDGGFEPDRAFGFVMLGSTDNSKISNVRVGDTGDWLWAGLVANYQINETLKLTGNLVYADVDAWDSRGIDGDGPNADGLSQTYALDNAWELSAVLQYTISKGADVYFSAGYLQPEFVDSDLDDDASFGALTRFELKF